MQIEKHQSKLYIVLALILVVITLFGCTSGAQDSNKQVEAQFRFTFINPQRDLNFWDDVNKGVIDASNDYGIDTIIVGPADIDEEHQIDDIKTAIASKVDGIITMPLESQNFIDIINEASDSGIPLVCVGGDTPESKRVAFFGSDNFLAGKLAGERAIELTDGTAKIGIISTSLTIDSIKRRIQGFESVIEEYPEMKIVDIKSSEANPIIAAQKTRQMLTEHPEVNLIFGTAGNDGPGIGNAIAELGNPKDIFVVALDDTPENIEHVKAGYIEALVAQSAYTMGYESVVGLYRLLNGETIEVLNYSDLIIVTQENVDTYK